MTENNQNSEINLNLKIPSDRIEEGGAFRDIVLTIYHARKVFFLCCIIGVTLGLVAAIAFYFTQSHKSTQANTNGETSISLTLNYPGAQLALFPDGETFNEMSFYEQELWINALQATGRKDVVPADAMRAVEITHLGALWIAQLNTELEKTNEGKSEKGEELQNRLLVNSNIDLVIQLGDSFLESSSEREVFLSSFCEEYKKVLNNKYFNETNIGILYGQHYAHWRVLCNEIQWHPFSYERNFTYLETRYSALAEMLKTLYREDPSYKTTNGNSFNDLAEELICIRDTEIRNWVSMVSDSVYIRNIDRFIQEFSYQIDSLNLEREYSLDIVSSYSDLLSSFQQKDTSDGTVVIETVDLLITAQAQADAAADLQKQIKQMELYGQMLNSSKAVILANSRDAEAALTLLISELKRSQESLSDVIFEYYRQVNDRTAENSVMVGSPVTTQIESTQENASITRVVIIFAGLSFVGVVIGFFAAFIKKYLPERVDVTTQ